MTIEDVQTNIRLPIDLKERLVKVAAQNKRSLSAEVAARLEGSFDSHGHQGVGGGLTSDIAKSTLESRLMELMVEQQYEKTNLHYAEEQLNGLEEQKSSLARLKRRAIEAERDASIRRYEALGRKIDAIFGLANLRGIHLSPEELNMAGIGAAAPEKTTDH